MRVTQLDGGAFTSAAGIWRRGESLGRMVRFPIPVYLIEVGEERVLVDTGLHPGAAADAASHYVGAENMRNFRLEQEVGLAEQVDLGSLTRVVMTHLHFDHDLDVQKASAERLHTLREAGAEVRPGHDPEVLAPGLVPLREGR